jgi:hypothetical protein
MPLRGIPEPVRHFLVQQVRSVEQLEVLVLLGAAPDREWTAAEVCDQLRSSVRSIEGRLGDLCAQGLLAATDRETGRAYRYAPATEDARRLVEEAASLYKERRLAVINLIYEPPERDAVSFANAFKIKRGG